LFFINICGLTLASKRGAKEKVKKEACHQNDPTIRPKKKGKSFNAVLKNTRGEEKKKGKGVTRLIDNFAPADGGHQKKRSKGKGKKTSAVRSNETRLQEKKKKRGKLSRSAALARK